jgi:hypothetical protein
MAVDRQMGPPNPRAGKRNMARALKIAKKLPGAGEGTSHGAMSVRVNDKTLGGVRGDGVFMINCASRNAKDFLLETQPEAFWQAPHYVTSSWVLVHMDKISDQQLFTALEGAWRARAPKKVVAEYDAKAKPVIKETAPKKAPAKKTTASRAPKDHFARVVKIAGKLPAIEIGASYGTPSLRVRKKFLCRMKEDGETLVVQTANLDEKEFLMETDPAVFYETPHYRGWPGVLIHLSKIDDKRLFNLLEASWKRHAGKKLLADYEGAKG